MTQNDTTNLLSTVATPRVLLKELCDVINNRPKNTTEYWTLLGHLEASQEWEQIQHMNKDNSPEGALLPSYLHNKLLFRSARDKNLMVELVTYTHLYNHQTRDMTQAMAVFDFTQKEMLVATDFPSDAKAETMPITDAALQRLFRDHNIDKVETIAPSMAKTKLLPISAN